MTQMFQDLLDNIPMMGAMTIIGFLLFGAFIVTQNFKKSERIVAVGVTGYIVIGLLLLDTQQHRGAGVCLLAALFIATGFFIAGLYWFLTHRRIQTA